MALTIFPIILLLICDIQEDANHAEKDLKLELYGRTVYILVQSFLSVLPSLCIWLAYLLPAHSMSGNGMELYNMGKKMNDGWFSNFIIAKSAIFRGSHNGKFYIH
jgi:hypothetical protein